jgi:hypothetical protein
MGKEIVIMDASISRMNARTIMDKGLYFAGFVEDKETWGTHNKDSGKKYNNVQEAIIDAKKLKDLYPDHITPHVFEITSNGPMININDVKY